MIFILIKNILDQKNLKSYYYVKMWIIIVHDFIFCAFQVIQRKEMKKSGQNVLQVCFITLYLLIGFIQTCSTCSHAIYKNYCHLNILKSCNIILVFDIKIWNFFWLCLLWLLLLWLHPKTITIICTRNKYRIYTSYLFIYL
jgi:hypothetical protein